jgi:glycosyltransferase involved in cell wall biosynthesis
MSARAGGVVLVTRKYPPSIGGMETLAETFFTCLGGVVPQPRLLALGRSQKHLVWWLPVALARVARLVATKQVDTVVCADALTFMAVRLLLWRSRVRVVTLVMGLDLTYPNPGYQRLLRRTLHRADRVVAISSATASEAAARGVAPERLRVLRLGVAAPDVSAADRAAARAVTRRLVGVAEGDVVLLTLGRLVPRKGVRWFVEHVLPALPSNVVLAVAGSGPDAEEIATAASTAGVAGRTRLLGAVDDETREALMCGADVFVQPNIPVPGDMEGFGLVTIEAALRGTPVLASDLEGLRDAVQDGGTGNLVPAGDPAAWIAAVIGLTADPRGAAETGERYRARARELYSAEAMAAQLGEALAV